MRARQPDDSGYAERDGVKLRWETFGDGEPTVVLLPTWSIIPSRHWKAQVPYLARQYRVVTFDGRGCGGSDRPMVSRATRTSSSPPTRSRCSTPPAPNARCSSRLSCGALFGIQVAADVPERVLGLVTIGAAVPLAPRAAERESYSFEDPIEETEGWAKYNRHYWERELRRTSSSSSSVEMFTEPHSTKQIEDCIGWGLEIEPGFARRHIQGVSRRAAASRSERSVSGSAAPSSSSTATTTRIRPLAQSVALADAHRRPARHDRGRWSRAACPRSDRSSTA